MTRPEPKSPLANTLSIIVHHLVSSNYSYLIIDICLHIVIWFQIFVSDIDNHIKL